MITCILCPIDGSEHSDKAVELACDLADRYQAKLVFLHVFLKGMNLDDLMQFESNAHLQDLVRQESERINELVRAMAGPYATPYVPPMDSEVVKRIGEVVVADAQLAAKQRGLEGYSALLADGDTVDLILSYAETLNADLIVMGHRGLGAIRALLGGSVSNKVSHQAQCTVVAVK